MTALWMDPKGKTWSTSPFDKQYYDLDRGVYCVNLETKGRVEGEVPQDKFNIDTAKVERVVMEGIDKAMRRYYARGGFFR